mgnify:CR=1 FL=1
MHDLFIICTSGHKNALISSLAFALEAKRVSQNVAVFFVQGSLAALADRKFEWAEELKDYGEQIEESLKSEGLSADPLELLRVAKVTGVDLIACGAWTKMLGVENRLPPEVRVELPSECLRMTLEAKKVLTIT